MNIAEKALELYPVRKKISKSGKAEYDQNAPRRKAFMRGYQTAREEFLKIAKEVKKQMYEENSSRLTIKTEETI